MCASLSGDAVVRANPRYRVADWASLPGVTRERVACSDAVPLDAAVLLGAPGSGLPAVLVDGSGARLFSALSRPGTAPEELSRDQLLRLVLDSVLEVETDGQWLSGPWAYEFLGGSARYPVASDRLAGLSYEALVLAAGTPRSSVDELCARLYGFGRIPLSRRWLRSYPDADAVRSLLGTPEMDRTWVARASGSSRPYWLPFSRRGTSVGSAGLTYKLYVSPDIRDLSAALGVVVTVLGDGDASHFKVGASAAGLLRPDKIVAYFSDPDQLLRTARKLTRALHGVRAHGVPFTATLDEDGLLSWAGDPPVGTVPLGGGVESWRLSVCRRLAEHLHTARRAALHRTTPTEYALARIGDDGVALPSFAPALLVPPGGVVDGDERS